MFSSALFSLAPSHMCLVLIGLWAPISTAQEAKETDSIVGIWELTADWGKGDYRGIHLLELRQDLTGTIREFGEEKSSELSDVTAKDNTIQFSFFFVGKKDVEVKFSGKLKNKTLHGTFSAFGAMAKVEGKRTTREKWGKTDLKKGKGRGTAILDRYEARKFTSSEGDTLPFRLLIPENYDASKKYPIVLFHHGGGGTGTNNRSQLESACIRDWSSVEFQAKHPCFILAPQLPGKSDKTKSLNAAKKAMQQHMRTIQEILDSLEKEYSIDTKREYVTGLSFGGACTWLSLEAGPKRFAGAVPVCAGNWLMEQSVGDRGKQFAQLPLWIFHGDEDKVITVEDSRAIVGALRAAGGKPNYTEFIGVGHYCWDKAYRDPKLIAWLFKQSL